MVMNFDTSIIVNAIECDLSVLKCSILPLIVWEIIMDNSKHCVKK